VVRRLVDDRGARLLRTTQGRWCLFVMDNHGGEAARLLNMWAAGEDCTAHVPALLEKYGDIRRALQAQKAVKRIA
jgi:hypothetical protein